MTDQIETRSFEVDFSVNAAKAVSNSNPSAVCPERRVVYSIQRDDDNDDDEVTTSEDEMIEKQTVERRVVFSNSYNAVRKDKRKLPGKPVSGNLLLPRSSDVISGKRPVSIRKHQPQDSWSGASKRPSAIRTPSNPLSLGGPQGSGRGQQTSHYSSCVGAAELTEVKLQEKAAKEIILQQASNASGHLPSSKQVSSDQVDTGTDKATATQSLRCPGQQSVDHNMATSRSKETDLAAEHKSLLETHKPSCSRLLQVEEAQQVIGRLEEQHRKLEQAGVQLIEQLQALDPFNDDIMNSQPMVQFLELVNKRNYLICQSEELSLIIKQLTLEDRQSQLDARLADYSDVQETKMNNVQIAEYTKLFDEKMALIKERDILVMYIEAKRIREQQDDIFQSTNHIVYLANTI